MRKNRNEEIIRADWDYYREDVEYFTWLCKINNLSRADMFRQILNIHIQTNTEITAKTCNEAHILKEIMPSPQN